jgi:hypothetical protein
MSGFRPINVVVALALVLLGGLAGGAGFEDVGGSRLLGGGLVLGR